MRGIRTRFLSRIRPPHVWLGCLALMGATAPSPGFTASDAQTLFEAHTSAFYRVQDGRAWFRETTEGGKASFWMRAEQMEMVLDAYECAPDPARLEMFTNLFHGFLADHGRDWSANEFNDDIMWMVIACARAHRLSGNTEFGDVARANFDACFARAWSEDLGGGLWWKTDEQSKNACVNGPAAIAAFLLHTIYGGTDYRARSERIYQWERATLFDTNSGAVSDSIGRDGERATFNLTYNQGTFIGAANRLGHTNDARLAADFMMNRLGRNGMMPRYGQRGDGGGFNGIGARWLARFMKERGCEDRYLAWLQDNAEAAWACRRLSDDLAWSRWPRPTPEGVLHSWACSSAVVLLQVVPPTQGNHPEAARPDDPHDRSGSRD